MNKPRTGKSVADIFSPKPSAQTEEEICAVSVMSEEMPKENQRGRPQEHDTAWSKATVVLLDKQIHWLDKLSLEIRHNTKVVMSRAEIIRAAVAAMEESCTDFTYAQSADEIKDLILGKSKEQQK